MLARKPGALRNRAPFKDWVLPAAMERVRRKLAGTTDGNRQMVDILFAVLTDGLPAVEAACAEAIAHGVLSADVAPPAARSGPAGHDPHPGRADAAPCTRRRLCPLRQPQKNHLMERTQLFDLMGELKLYGMKAAFDEIMATAVKRQHEPQRIVGDLLNAGINEKQARSIKYQLTIAKLPLAKDINGFQFEGTPINQTLVNDLAGKTHLAIAIARSCVRTGARCRFLQCGRSRQPGLRPRLATDGKAGSPSRSSDPHGLPRPRRTRLFALRSIRLLSPNRFNSC